MCQYGWSSFVWIVSGLSIAAIIAHLIRTIMVQRRFDDQGAHHHTRSMWIILHVPLVLLVVTWAVYAGYWSAVGTAKTNKDLVLGASYFVISSSGQNLGESLILANCDLPKSKEEFFRIRDSGSVVPGNYVCITDSTTGGKVLLKDRAR